LNNLEYYRGYSQHSIEPTEAEYSQESPIKEGGLRPMDLGTFKENGSGNTK
jgi:hypothetical protein